MRLRITTMFVLAAALSLEATAASAQGTDSTRRARSTTRIPVTKEAPGEVVQRVDTVMIYRTDTLRVFRTDTVNRYRTDTVRIEVRAPMPKPLRQIGGFYYGLAAGAAMTLQDLDNAQNGGFHIELPIGWDPIGSMFGLRADGAYTALQRQSAFQVLGSDLPNPQMWSFNLDAKLRYPIRNAFSSRWQIYAVGGGSYNWFKNIVEVGDGLISIGDSLGINGDFPLLPDNDWHGKWGWNAGGGVGYGWGHANIYAESRVIGFSNRVTLNRVPLVVGFSWF